MNAKITASLLAATLAVTGCAGGYAGQNYTPIIDTAASQKDPAQYPVDLAACQALGAQTSQLADAAIGGGLGAAGGAGAGAIGGAIKGGGKVAEGAGLGALAGLVVGAAYEGINSNRARQDTVIECMERRGWPVVGR